MPPLLPPLAQSESKARFLHRLSLDQSNAEHRAIYCKMKAEAIQAREGLLKDHNVFIQRCDSLDDAPESPSSAQLKGTALHAAVVRVYRNASEETRTYYKQGLALAASDDISSMDNWVIRWMLWHVFRYRDARNRNRAPSGPRLLDSMPSTACNVPNLSPVGESPQTSISPSEASPDESLAPSNLPPPRRLPYDPIRD